ncbi:MAG: hypothetical protein ACK46E_02825, partial [Pseudanabaena sp.]
DIVTLFPEFFTSPLQTSLLGKAIANQIAEVHLTNPRDFTTDKHHRVDDEPYGGGAGMLMKPDPIFAAVESLPILPKRVIIYMTPQGEPMRQNLFKELVGYDQLVLQSVAMGILKLLLNKQYTKEDIEKFDNRQSYV